jgi:competence protein ComEC
MFRIGGTILCFAYIIGLLSTGVSSDPVHQFSIQQWTGLFLAIFLLTIVITIFVPRFWPLGPTRPWWISAGIVVLLAVFYFHLRVPHQSLNDITQQLAKFEGNVSPIVEVKGKILNQPKVTRTQKGRFVLQAKEFQQSSATTERVRGKLYVTVPLLQATGLYPSQTVTLTGKLYQPSPVVDAGGFDFALYLVRQGIWAGFTADVVEINQDGNLLNWALWQLQTRIIRTHVRWLKVPAGTLVSSIVLGRRGIDLPYPIQDLFIQAGLAHILAASGFQVSLLLGAVLWLTNSFSVRVKLMAGVSSLLVYLTLTGFYPSVLRASLMGMAVLVGIVTNRRVRPSGSLLLAATMLLLVNPLWIWDLGFQLSFLATLGLIVTLPAIMARLDWLPPAIAASMALPLAASLWTLPLQIYTFNTIPVYTIPINMIATPLVTIISLGGMLSGLVGIIFSELGSAIAWLLYYPTLSLIKIVQLVANLPGTSVVVGRISGLRLLFCYVILVSLWFLPWGQKRWWLLSLWLVITLIFSLIG